MMITNNLFSNNSGKTNNLVLVDDIENYHNYEFLCVAYDDENNYTVSNKTKI